MKVSKSTLAGIVCALCCAGCVAAYSAHVNDQAESDREEALARYGGEQIEVLVAARDIAAGETISEGSVESKLWLADLLPEGAATSSMDVVGKQAGSSILKGEVISTQRLSKDASDLSIPDGMAAVSVPARDVQAVGGALQPGMCTDVYATGSSSTTLLVEDALILETSLSEPSSLSSSAAAWITLAVPAASVQELVSAAQNLDLYFVLLGSDAETEVPDDDRDAEVSEPDGDRGADVAASAEGHDAEARE